MSDSLFDVPDPTAPAEEPGATEAALRRSITAGLEAGTLVAEDAGMIEAALIAARSLDRADRLPPHKSVYAVPQNMRPLQDALHALRLPAALSPVPPPAPAPGGSQPAPADSWGDLFGTPSAE